MLVALIAESEVIDWKKNGHVVSTLSWWFRTDINISQNEHKYLAVKRLQASEQKELARRMLFEILFSLRMFKSVSKAISKQIVRTLFISK